MQEIPGRESTRSVFVVDDDDDSLCYYREILRAAGMHVETFVSAESFLARVRPSDSGCLLLDLRMPGTSGLELQQKLSDVGCPITIVLISGDADVESCSAGFRAGAFDFVEKSISDDELIQLIRRAADEAERLKAVARHDSIVRERTALLTARELDVKELMLRGLSIKEIAFQLQIAFQTAAKHRSRVLEKMEVDSDAELIRLESGQELSEEE